jgi:hypothetical protein
MRCCGVFARADVTLGTPEVVVAADLDANAIQAL